MAGKVTVSLSLSKEAREIISRASESMGISKADVVEIAVRKQWKKEVT